MGPHRILCAVFACQLLVAHAYVSRTTRSILEDLFLETHGPSWIYPPNSVPWSFGSNYSDPCADGWAGITCSGEATKCVNTECFVTELQLPSYGMVGTLPDSLSGLVNVTHITFENNALGGTLDLSMFYEMQDLRFLYLNENDLEGTIPSSITTMTELGLLKLRGNRLHGSLPSAFGDMSNLFEVHFSLNSFTGTIPSTLEKLSRTVNYLSFRDNKFSGTLPSQLGGLSKLGQLSLYNNKLHGSLPSSLGDLSQLNLMVFHTNSFTGRIPSSLGKLTGLAGLYLQKNCFVGSIPVALCELTSLVDLDLSENGITSTLPLCIGQLSLLETLQIGSNKLQGILPPEIGNIITATYISVDHNMLTGTIPLSIARMTGLKTVELNNNRFSGSLDILNEMHNFSSIEFIDVSYNDFSGGLPKILFISPSLKYFDASKNCLTQRIPSTICLSNLNTLSINGLSSGRSCRNQFLDILGIFKSHPATKVEGSLPLCILQMPSMQQLYVNGNLLNGDLSSVEPGPNLKELGLGTNLIEGTISAALLTHDFSMLDLSYNRIVGDLRAFDDNFVTCDAGPNSTVFHNRTLSLKVNRLSGLIPICFDEIGDINVIGGNYFDCNEHHRLPSDDPAAESSTCGSVEFDNSLIAYAVALTLVCGALTWIFLHEIASVKFLYREICSFILSNSTWLNLRDEALNAGAGLRNFGSTVHGMLKTTVILYFVLVLVALPIYGVLGKNYALTSNSYGWRLSLVQLNEWPASVAGLIVWIITMTSCIMATFTQLRRWQGGESATLISIVKRQSIFMLSERFSTVSTVVDNPLNKNSSNASIEVLKAESVAIYNMITKKFENGKLPGLSYLMISVMLIFNVVLVTALNVAYIVSQASDMTVNVKILLQFLFAVFGAMWNKGGVIVLVRKLNCDIQMQVFLCILFGVVNTIVIPCISMIWTSENCFNGMIVGLGDVTVVVTHEECLEQTFTNGVITCTSIESVSTKNLFERPFTYNGGCSQSIFSTYIPVFVFTYTIDIIFVPVIYWSMANFIRELKLIAVPRMLWLSTQASDYQLLRGGQLYIIFFSHIALMLTFGIASPALATIIVIGAIQDVLLYIYVVRRYLKCSPRCTPSNPTGGLELASREIPRDFIKIYLLIIWTSAFFYGTILFDYAADGQFQAIFLSIPAVLLGYVVVCTVMLRWCRQSLDDSVRSIGTVARNSINPIINEGGSI